MLKHITGLPGVYPVPGKRQVREAGTEVAGGDSVALSRNQHEYPGMQALTITAPMTYASAQGQVQQTIKIAAAATNASFTTAAFPGPAGYVVGIGETWLQDDGANNGGDLINFRLCTDPFPEMSHPPPSRLGLDELHISGSSQFSPQDLAAMKERIPADQIIMIDLREESHFYGDDRSFSWRNYQNNVNMGASEPQVRRLEEQWLKDLSREEGTMGLRPRKVSTEEDICREQGIGYCRIPVTDHLRPEDRDVDQFVSFVRTMPEGAWLNFHCKAGKGRTTTFMAMYDMMRNAGRVSVEEIAQRQYLLGGVDLLGDQPAKDSYRHIAAVGRKRFSHDFYQYCLECKDNNFALSWSTWKKLRGI